MSGEIGEMCTELLQLDDKAGVHVAYDRAFRGDVTLTYGQSEGSERTVNIPGEWLLGIASTLSLR